VPEYSSSSSVKFAPGVIPSSSQAAIAANTNDVLAGELSNVILAVDDVLVPVFD